MIFRLKFSEKTTKKQNIDYREFLTGYQRCRNIIIILLCVTQQLKLKINYRPLFTCKEDSRRLNILPLGREKRFYLVIIVANFSKTQTEWVGHINSPLGVFIFTLQNTPSLPGYTFNILPNGQGERGASFDLIIARSFFERLISKFVYLVLLVNVGK